MEYEHFAYYIVDRFWEFKMKKLIGSVFVILMMTFGSLIAQTDESSIKAALANLFSYSKSNAFDKAALLIAYDGENKERINKDSFDPQKQNELDLVKRRCKKISALLNLSTKYELGQIIKKEENDKVIFSVEVNFISGEQKLTESYNFIKTDKGFLLSA